MSLQLPRFQSKKNSLELERENFEKVQATSLSKAINNQETAVKEKHVRSAIIGTYQERGASTFWDCVFRLQTKENPIVCWKFCFVLHKVLREGHENVIRDSQRYKPMLPEHGKFWGHLKTGYGSLIKDYCTLMETKLTFHQRNPRIPGNLDIEYQDLVTSIGDNIDAFFQLSVEMLDYLDAILELKYDIFKTIQSSKCTSMTHPGQCRLTPLIPCIQDSMILYDFTTKILFHLHAKLPPDLLEGHRTRFLKVFQGLSDLYQWTMNLQYFKNLIAIQQLPKNPPNFLMQSDLENYETRKVTVYQPDDTQNDIHSDTVSDIVDLTDSNGSGSPDPAAMALQFERERRIKELEDEIQRLREQLRLLKEEAKNRIHQLQFELKELSMQLQDTRQQLMEKERRIEELEQHECKIPNDIAAKLDVAEKSSATWEDKFSKMKNLYTNLREEHIGLLRKKGAADKELGELRKVVEGQTEMSTLIENLRKDKEEVENNLFTKLSKKDAQCEELEATLTDLKAQIQTVELSKQNIEGELKLELEKVKSEFSKLTSDKSSVDERNQNLLSQVSDLNSKFEKMSEELSSVRSARDDFQAQVRDLHARIGDNQKNMENEALKRYNEMLNICIQENKVIIKATIEELENPLLTGGSGALDNFMINCRGTESMIIAMEGATHNGYGTFSALREILERIPHFTHHISNLMIHGSATSRTSSDIQKGDEMLEDCRNVGVSVLSLLDSIEGRISGQKIDQSYEGIREQLRKLLQTANSLGSCLTPEADAAEVLDKELHMMELAIEEASKKMEEMLKNSRESHTGVKLEVNEKLIDSCTTLMNAIRLLVQRAKFLQKEIVSQGKGSASVKEFYKRNHQWTEGLISAAKAIGGGAKFLLESADKAIGNPAGGFELLIASSQDIAASTIQLVVASQVRADRSSQNLTLLKQASTGVKTATAGVVATAKDCTQLIEESDEVDLANISTHNAKRLELETQAEVLRLQSELEKSRMKLAALRQHHYHNSE